MKREPSLHILRSTLFDLLKEYNEVHDLGYSTDDLVKYLLKRGKKYSVHKRSRLEINSKNKKKAKTIEYSSTGATELFGKILTLIRKQRKRKGNEIIKEGTKKWHQLREASELALDFCKAFGLEQKEGYTIYINLAMDVMTYFNLGQLNNKHEKICEAYQAEIDIAKDPNKNITEEMYETYVVLVLDRIGVEPDYIQSPDRYINFVRAAEIARKLNIDGESYIKANFEQLEWTAGIPDPEQLVTPKAKNRVIRWLVEHKDDKKNNEKTINKEIKRLQNILSDG